MARGRRLARLKAVQLSPEVAEKYLLDWETPDLRENPEGFPWLTSEALFGNELPLAVEIGSGTGEALVARAAEDPASNFLGIEVSRRAAEWAANLAAEAALDNLRILRANLHQLDRRMQPQSWQRAFLHFPDPVHKRKDEKRNVFTQHFLDQLAKTLVVGGELSVASDRRDYFMRMLALAETDERFEKTHAERYLEGLDTPAKSRFQRFWERKGVVPLHFMLRKRK